MSVQKGSNSDLICFVKITSYFPHIQVIGIMSLCLVLCYVTYMIKVEVVSALYIKLLDELKLSNPCTGNLILNKKL